MKLLSLDQVRALSPEKAKQYCQRLRATLVENVTQTGGHLASNLGVVEISVALARGLDLPREKVVYDTGHQSYVHKLLTGRGREFATLRSLGGISGFPRREESVFDAFGTGHSGTGISAALGLARGMRLRGEDGFAVAVLGDGAFSCGMCFEALNNISSQDRLIIILNDNGMSISKSVGRVKSALNKMRTAGYYRLKDEVQETLSRMPLVGGSLSGAAQKIKDTVKRVALPQGNLFEQLGLHYFGPADGNDLETVEFLLKEAKKRNRPSVIHLCTKKGKGYAPAEQEPSRYHGISPKKEKTASGESFSSLFGNSMLNLARKDPAVCALTAAMTDGVGLGEFAREFPDRFFDVGIAEEHGITFAAALSAAGMKPCFALYSTFYQRAVDQMLHDAALQKIPMVLALDRAGLSGEDGATHHGVFDLPLTLPIPGVKIYAPVSGGEMERCLEEAFSEKESPSVIRYAKGCESDLIQETFPLKDPIEGKDFGTEPRVTVVTFGRITEQVILACQMAEQIGVSSRLVRFCTLKGFSQEPLEELFRPGTGLLFVEEGVLCGGFSAYLKEILEEKGLLNGKRVRVLGIGEEFVPHGATEDLIARLGLDYKTIGKELIRLAEN